MYSLMFSSVLAQVQIFDPVVALVGVDVMNDLAIDKRSSKVLFHDDAVLK
jgi:hypothetical protein